MPENHPKSDKYRYAFAFMLFCRHNQTESVRDLDLAIETMERSVASMAESHNEHDVDRRRNYIKQLETYYKKRAIHIGSVEDLKRAQELNIARTSGSSQNGDGVSSHSLYIESHVYSVKYKIHGNPRDLERAIELGEECISITPDGDINLSMYLNGLSIDLQSRFLAQRSRADIDRAIQLSEKCIRSTANDDRLSQYYNALSDAYGWRGKMLSSVEDIDHALDLKRKVLLYDHHTIPMRQGFQTPLIGLLDQRFTLTKSTNDLDEAIAVEEELLASLPKDDPRYNTILTLHSGHSIRRSGLRDLTELTYLQQSVFKNPGTVLYDGPKPIVSLQFEASRLLSGTDQDLEYAISLCQEIIDSPHCGSVQRSIAFGTLCTAFLNRFFRKDASKDIEDAVSAAKQAVDLTSKEDIAWHLCIARLGLCLQHQFLKTGSLSALNEAIDIGEESLKLLSEDHQFFEFCVLNLASGFWRRFRTAGTTSDLDRAIMFNERFARLDMANPLSRFHAAIVKNWTLHVNHHRSYCRRTQQRKCLTALEHHQIVHLSCHGHSDPKDPSRSKFLLHDWQTNPLTVSDLSILNLKNAQLAFLSACRTADIKDIKLMDESIHLCSAMQLAGFPSVIGNLWEVADNQAAQLAEDVYSHMLKKGTMLQTHKSAESLQHAVLMLRERTRNVRGVRKRTQSDPFIWACYVHIGA